MPDDPEIVRPEFINRLPAVFRQECPSHEDALRWAKLGAYYLLGLTEDRDKQALILEEAAEHHRQQVAALRGGNSGPAPWKKFLVGDSRAMSDIDHIIRLIASRRCSVLITGETGTGKEWWRESCTWPASGPTSPWWW